jgi:hypothetical protein
MRDAERLRDRRRVEQSESAGRCDQGVLGESLGITSQGRGFQPAHEYARGIDGVQPCRQGLRMNVFSVSFFGAEDSFNAITITSVITRLKAWASCQSL